MSGADEMLKIGLYVIIMLIVIYIGISLVAGFDPREWTKKLSSATFEPGKVIQTQSQQYLNEHSILECSQTNYRLTTKDLKFDIKPGTDVEGGELNFIVVLDLDNKLFVGTDESGYDKIVKCTDKGNEFNCGDNTIYFDIRCTGGLNAKEVFHFTTWLYKPAVRDAMLPDQCNYPSLSKILDNYGQFYLSSFNFAKNDIQAECEKTDCRAKSDETTCKEDNKCYWRAPIFWINSCDRCPTSSNCNDYDSEQCSKCTVAVANGCTPSFFSCNPAGP